MLRYGLTVLPLAGALLIYNAWSQTGGLWGIVIPVVLFVGHISLVGANAMTGLMGHFPSPQAPPRRWRAPCALALGPWWGPGQPSIPRIAAPMAIAIAGCGLGSALSYWLLSGKRVP